MSEFIDIDRESQEQIGREFGIFDSKGLLENQHFIRKRAKRIRYN